jgi:UDP-glucuronate 4-epimerase
MANAGLRDMVLVTGAAGFIGFHVAARLLRERMPVLGIDNFDPAYDRETKETNVRDLRAVAADHDVPFEFAVQDICRIEPGFADGRLCGVVHLAAKTGVRHSVGDAEGYAQTNVVGTLRILELCRAQGIDRLLFASSSSVYGDDTPPPFSEDARAERPLSPYAASKRAGELFCATYAHLHGVRAAALRFFAVYGPRQRPHLAIHEFTRRIDRGEPVRLFGDGSSERGYAYIDDVVDGVWAAWRHVEAQPKGSFDVFNLGGPDTVSLQDLVVAIEGEMGQRAAVIREPEQPGDVHRTFADPSRARAVLGYEPRVPFPEGLRRFLAWYREARFDAPRPPEPRGPHSPAGPISADRSLQK